MIFDIKYLEINAQRVLEQVLAYDNIEEVVKYYGGLEEYLFECLNIYGSVSAEQILDYLQGDDGVIVHESKNLEITLEDLGIVRYENVKDTLKKEVVSKNTIYVFGKFGVSENLLAMFHNTNKIDQVYKFIDKNSISYHKQFEDDFTLQELHQISLNEVKSYECEETRNYLLIFDAPQLKAYIVEVEKFEDIQISNHISSFEIITTNGVIVSNTHDIEGKSIGREFEEFFEGFLDDPVYKLEELNLENILNSIRVSRLKQHAKELMGESYYNFPNIVYDKAIEYINTGEYEKNSLKKAIVNVLKGEC